MNMNFRKSVRGAFWGAALAIAPGAFADNTVELTVTGTIEAQACSISLTSNLVDLGSVYARELSATQMTALGWDFVVMNVQCSAPTQFALKTLDGAGGSAYGAKNDRHYGLGLTDAGEPIGYYTLRFETNSITADSVLAKAYHSTNTVSWELAPVSAEVGGGDDLGEGPYLRHGIYMAFGLDSASDIGTFTEMEAWLFVRGYIAPTEKLALSDEVTLKGNATIEIVYL